MYRLVVFVLATWMNPLFAGESLLFKQELIVNNHWISYALVLVALLIILLALAKYSRKSGITNPKCKVLERITVHHKTKIYVIDYQGQQFLLADNQNTLSIHPLQEGRSDHG